MSLVTSDARMSRSYDFVLASRSDQKIGALCCCFSELDKVDVLSSYDFRPGAILISNISYLPLQASGS
jgi:hypothetical protein